MSKEPLRNLISTAERRWRSNMHFGEIWDDSVVEFEAACAPDRPTSEQFLDRLHGCTDFEAERRMLQEILADAIACWQSVSAIGVIDGNYVTSLRERLYREANFWIFGEYDNAPLFSFAQICDCLGLNPDFIRRRLLEWRRKSAGR
jgi:hypothetical protein